MSVIAFCAIHIIRISLWPVLNVLCQRTTNFHQIVRSDASGSGMTMNQWRFSSLIVIGNCEGISRTIPAVTIEQFIQTNTQRKFVPLRIGRGSTISLASVWAMIRCVRMNYPVYTIGRNIYVTTYIGILPDIIKVRKLELTDNS